MAGALGDFGSLLGGGVGGTTKKRRIEQPGQQGQQPGQQPPTGGVARTFSQMQQQGVARPAPPPPVPPPTSQYGGSQQAGDVRASLGQSVAQSLAAPSRYDTTTFNTIRDAATKDLTAQYAKIRDTTNTDLARRGLAASTFGANDLHDVDAAQSRSLADLNSTLLQQAATTQAGDTAQAQSSAANLSTIAGTQDLNTYQANATNALAVGGLTGTYGDTPTLAAKSLEQSGQQFNLQQSLAEKLGTGNLNIQQQQQALSEKLGLAGLTADQQRIAIAQKQQEAESAYQAGTLSLQDRDAKLKELSNAQQYGLQSQSLDLNKTATLGNLDVSRQQANTQTAAQQAEAAQAKAALEQSGSQFGQSLAEQQAARAQSGSQFNLQQSLAEKLGTGNLGVQQQQANTQTAAQQAEAAQAKAALEQSGSQFTASQAQQGSQFALQQALADKLGTGNLDLGKASLAQQGTQSAAQLAEQDKLGLLADTRSGQQIDATKQANQSQFLMQLLSMLGGAGLMDKITANDKTAADKAAADKIASDKAAADRIAADKAAKRQADIDWNTAHPDEPQRLV